ncbi:hypothetical protein ES703_106715 [subsurface metagenome]
MKLGDIKVIINEDTIPHVFRDGIATNLVVCEVCASSTCIEVDAAAIVVGDGVPGDGIALGGKSSRTPAFKSNVCVGVGGTRYRVTGYGIVLSTTQYYDGGKIVLKDVVRYGCSSYSPSAGCTSFQNYGWASVNEDVVLYGYIISNILYPNGIILGTIQGKALKDDINSKDAESRQTRSLTSL